MKEFFMKCLEWFLTILSYPYDIILLLMTLLYVAGLAALTLFIIAIRGFLILGHGLKFDETLKFQNIFKYLGNVVRELKEM